MLSHGLEDVLRGDDVLLDVLPRVEEPVLHVGVRGEVEDEVLSGHRAADRGEVEQVCLDERDPGALVDQLPIARREVVEDRHPRTGADERVHHVATDEAGPSRDDDRTA